MFLRNLIVGALCAAAGLAQASTVTLASDNFNSYSNGTIAGANGGTGWAGAWTGSSSATVVTAASNDAPIDGQALRFANPDATNAASRQLAQAVSGNVFVDFLLQFDSGSIQNNDFLALWFGNSNGPNIGLKANCDGAPGCNGADLFIRSGNAAYSTNITIGQTVHLFGFLEKVGGSNVYNRYSLWVDPTADEMSSLTGADATLNGSSGMSSFSTIGFRTANLDLAVNGTAADGVLIDNLSIGVVPEPGSLALVGLALAGLGWTRRRRA